MEKVVPGGIFKYLEIDGLIATVEFEVPANRIVELLYGEFKCTTCATVANRTFRCSVLAKDASRVLTLFEFTLAASLTKRIDLGIPKITETILDDAIQLPRLLLNGGMKLQFYISLGEAGDVFSFYGQYLEWVD